MGLPNLMCIKQFKALSDETRLEAFLQIWQHGQLNVNHLASILDVPQSSLSYHLKILTGADLITLRTQGAWHYYEVNEPAVAGLLSQHLFSGLKSLLSNAS